MASYNNITQREIDEMVNMVGGIDEIDDFNVNGDKLKHKNRENYIEHNTTQLNLPKPKQRPTHSHIFCETCKSELKFQKYLTPRSTKMFLHCPKCEYYVSPTYVYKHSVNI